MSFRYAVRSTNVANTSDCWEVWDTVTGRIVFFGLTNSQAWREADKLNREATSRAEDTSDWMWKKGMDH